MPEYRTPGVYIEEISGGPRPVQASATTDTGFVAVLTLPTSFVPGRGAAAGMFLPAQEEQLRLAWNRVLAFRGLLPAPAAAADAGEAGGDAPPAAAAPPPPRPKSPTASRPWSKRPCPATGRSCPPMATAPSPSRAPTARSSASPSAATS